jgi:folate/biopterin transporter
MAMAAGKTTEFDPEENNASKGKTENSPLLGEKSEAKSPGLKLSGLSDFGPVKFLLELQEHFGYKLLALLFIVQHNLKGLSSAYFGRAQPYLLKSYHVPGPQMQIVSGIVKLPWALKPIIGLVSDVLPIGGYNKAPYMMVVSVLGALSCILIGVLPKEMLSITLIIVFGFFFNLQVSTCDLLSEAKYAEKMQRSPAKGSSLLTYVWFGMNVAGFVATITSGTLIHQMGPKVLFIVAAVPAAFTIYPVMMGYMEETKLTPEELAENRARYLQQKEACGLCVLMLISSIAVMGVGLISRDPAINCAVAVAVGMAMLVCFSMVLSPVIAKFNAFSLIQTALSLSTGGASFYFYTDTPEQYPEGPHFSDFFYNSVLGTAGTVFSLLGIYTYQRYMSNWKYRSLLIVTNITLSAFSALDIMMYARLNKKIGVPDHALVFGLSCIETVIAQWQWMPQVVILSYLCPKGMEATMYALLAGCHNMGGLIAGSCGALLLSWLGVKPKGEVGESAQFDNLWVAAALSTVLPLLAILILYWLIPDARQNEKIIDASDDATTGSLWKRMTGSR